MRKATFRTGRGVTTVPLKAAAKRRRQPGSTGQPDSSGYHRPMDIEVVPDDRVLPPPRPVRGVNGED